MQDFWHVHAIRHTVDRRYVCVEFKNLDGGQTTELFNVSEATTDSVQAKLDELNQKAAAVVEAATRLEAEWRESHAEVSEA